MNAKQRVPDPASFIPYAEICKPRLQCVEVALLTSTTYETYVSVGLYAQGMNKVNCLRDTDAGSNLINKSFEHPIWIPRVKRRDVLKLRSANKQLITSIEVIM